MTNTNTVETNTNTATAAVKGLQSKVMARDIPLALELLRDGVEVFLHIPHRKYALSYLVIQGDSALEFKGVHDSTTALGYWDGIPMPVTAKALVGWLEALSNEYHQEIVHSISYDLLKGATDVT